MIYEDSIMARAGSSCSLLLCNKYTLLLLLRIQAIPAIAWPLHDSFHGAPLCQWGHQHVSATSFRLSVLLAYVLVPKMKQIQDLCRVQHAPVSLSFYFVLPTHLHQSSWSVLKYVIAHFCSPGTQEGCSCVISSLQMAMRGWKPLNSVEIQ